MTDTRMIDGEWLDQLDALRPLALRLVRDESRADDAVQRALLKAMTSRGLPKKKGFWARVIRNEAIDDHRSEQTRKHHEARVSGSSTAPATHSVVTEAESQSLVSEAVLALEEPYRTVILLRYFKGQRVRQIAAELDRPLGTVQSQLERGLVLLRDRLRGSFGNGQALALSLLPLATSKASLFGATAAPLSLLFIPLAMKLALVISLAALGWLAFRSTTWMSAPNPALDTKRAAAGEALPPTHSPHQKSERKLAPTPPLPPDGESRKSLGNPAVAERTPVASPAEIAAAEPLIAGIATRFDAAPFKDAKLVLGDKGATQRTVQTGDNGHFKYKAGDEVRAHDKSWALVASRESLTLGEFVFAPTVRFAGQVVDESGVPLPRVLILDTQQTVQAGLDTNVGWHQEGVSIDSAKKDGRFDLQGVAAWTGRSLAFTHPLFGEYTVPVPSSDQLDATIVFPGATAGYELTVRVMGAGGIPAADAAVAFGHQIVAVDTRGEAKFDVHSSIVSTTVTSIRHGFLPVSELPPTIAEARGGAEARTLVLTQTATVAPISGVVVEADGTPVQGAEVGAWSGRYFGNGHAFESVRVVDGEVVHRRIVTDSEGRFTLPRAELDPARIRAAVGLPLRMGEATSSGGPVRVVLPPPAMRREVRGMVVDFNGDPVENARVMIVARLSHAQPGGNVHWQSSVATPMKQADAEGRFEFLDVGGGELEITAAYGSDRVFEPIDPGSLDLTVELDLHCKVELSVDANPQGTTLAVLDAKGNVLPLTRHYGALGMVWNEGQQVAAQGATMLFEMPQSAREARLMLNGKTVRSAVLRPSSLHLTRVDL